MEINKEKYLSKFKVFESPLLFDLDYSVLRDNRCPICFNKLKILRNGKRAICNSKKHKKAFTIGIEQLNKLTNKNHVA